MFAKVERSKTKADILKQLISAKKEIKGRETQRVLGEQAFCEDTDKLFKPIINTQNKIGDKQNRLLALQNRALANVIEHQRGIPAIQGEADEVEEPIIQEPEEMRIEQVEPEYPDLGLKGIYGLDTRIGTNDYLQTRPLSRDQLNDLSNDELIEHGDAFRSSYLELKTHLEKPIVKAKTKQHNLRNAYLKLGKAGLYLNYLREYISWRDSIQPSVDAPFGRFPPPLEGDDDAEGSGLKGRSRVVKKTCNNVQILGTPKEILDELSLAVASIKAGNTSSILKNKVITIADYLYKNKYIRKPTYLEIFKVMK